MLELLLLPPIFKGFIAMVAAGLSFPLTGVMVVRMNLLPLRYTLMHGLILGGAISLALSLPDLPVYVVTSLLIVLLMLAIGRSRRLNLGVSSSFLMVLSIALASLIAQKADVPAKDTLDMLWGSPFTISPAELSIFIALSLFICLYVALDFRMLGLLFFDGDIARTVRRDAPFHQGVAVLLTALTVSLAMRFVGALLIDALLLLPVMIAMKRARGLRELFILSSVTGFASSVIGYLVSLRFDLPPSAAVSIVSVILFIALPRRKDI